MAYGFLALARTEKFVETTLTRTYKAAIFLLRMRIAYRTSALLIIPHPLPNNSAKVVTRICYIWEYYARADGILNINL